MSKTNLSTLLLKWYDLNGRQLPWRVKGGAHPNPYVILVSEFMLQQTTVKTVIPYFERFMQRFPDINTLARADLEEVYLYWQGLGYYTRARSLHTTAQIIMKNYAGKFPQSKQEILKLKGFGPYTAASFLALAFNQAETVIDGNVTRIICRLHHLTEPTDKITDKIRELATELTDSAHASDYASAIMDLGALICTPKNPLCRQCPWNKFCQSKNCADLEKIPYKTKISKTEKNGFVYLIFNDQGQIFIRKRTEPGLLTGLYEFPWSETPLYQDAINTNLTISHIFTHIKLTLNIQTLLKNTPPTKGIFINIAELENYPLSTLMKKVINTWQKHN